jgi:hypothetical protein
MFKRCRECDSLVAMNDGETVSRGWGWVFLCYPCLRRLARKEQGS